MDLCAEIRALGKGRRAQNRALCPALKIQDRQPDILGLDLVIHNVDLAVHGHRIAHEPTQHIEQMRALIRERTAAIHRPCAAPTDIVQKIIVRPKPLKTHLAQNHLPQPTRLNRGRHLHIAIHVSALIIHAAQHAGIITRRNQPITRFSAHVHRLGRNHMLARLCRFNAHGRVLATRGHHHHHIHIVSRKHLRHIHRAIRLQLPRDFLGQIRVQIAHHLQFRPLGLFDQPRPVAPHAQPNNAKTDHLILLLGPIL